MHNQNWLRSELAAIEAIDPSSKARLGSGWRASRARAVVGEVISRFAPLAAKLNVSPGDVATAALDAWHAADFTIPSTHDAWGWTGAAVKRLVAAEQTAERFLTTAGSANARRSSDLPIPARVEPTEYEERFGGVETVRATTDEVALKAAARFLVGEGLGESQSWNLLDTLAATVLGDDFETSVGRPSGSTSRATAVKVLQRERMAIAEDLGIDADLVALVTKLLFGSRQRGGLLELRADGAEPLALAAYLVAFAGRFGHQSATPE